MKVCKRVAYNAALYLVDNATKGRIQSLTSEEIDNYYNAVNEYLEEHGAPDIDIYMWEDNRYIDECLYTTCYDLNGNLHYVLNNISGENLFHKVYLSCFRGEVYFAFECEKALNSIGLTMENNEVVYKPKNAIYVMNNFMNKIDKLEIKIEKEPQTGEPFIPSEEVIEEQLESYENLITSPMFKSVVEEKKEKKLVPKNPIY